MLKPALQEWLRRLALGDERAVERVMCGGCADIALLDDKTAALVRLSTLVAARARGPVLLAGVDGCYAAGIERAEIVGMLDSIARVVGDEQAQSNALIADGF